MNLSTSPIRSESRQPVFAYINWAAYDLLSDDKPLTEDLALKELDEVIRLRSEGVRLDYYLMDAFWYDPDGGYRKWHPQHWPNGHHTWMRRCLDEGIKPGIWLATNNLMVPGFRHLNPIPEWEGSLSEGDKVACMFEGPFLPHFMESMHQLHEEGFRLFKFDFANLQAVPKGMEQEIDKASAIEKNSEALRVALNRFKATHPEAILIAYNGFGFDHLITDTWQPMRQMADPRWLECFDTLYAGDPRPSDIPCANFWRSKDIYSDHMVFQFADNGIPLARIDNAGFMIGKTGTCYFRGKEAWKGMFLLSLARGGWVNTYYGNLELLDASDAAFINKAQNLFLPPLQKQTTSLFGGPPGSGIPYGFRAEHPDGTIFTVINPSDHTQTVYIGQELEKARCVFHDEGFQPLISSDSITLGSEQLAVVATGQLAQTAPLLGTEEMVVIPRTAESIAILKTGPFSAVFEAKTPGIYRVRARIFDAQHKPRRSSGGSPPSGTHMDKMTRIIADNDDAALKQTLSYGKQIWSGLSWAVVDLEVQSPAKAVRVRLESTDPLVIEAEFGISRIQLNASGS